ncbi:MAG: 30S ribosomal protein S13 [Planctomycetota bacterium]|jgi:small subunit ribosomal protein S13
MPRIAGVDIPGDKPTRIALTYIHGVGRTTADRLCAELGLEAARRSKDLSGEELSRIAAYIDKNLVVEGQLRRQVTQNIARLRKTGSYRGLRHARGLPVRGQRTRTNARQRKGKKKTVAGKKSVKEMR